MHDRTNRVPAAIEPAREKRLLTLLVIVAILVGARSIPAQSIPTATRAGDLQIGGGFSFARSGYNFTPLHLIGGTFYTSFAWKHHWGGEFDFHNVKGTADSTVYERTYEIGPRFFLVRGPMTPYVKAMYGRGIYNFSQNRANLAYNIYTLGGGLDFAVRRSIRLRADYEYQSWAGFPLGTLHPSLITLGAAYHFHE